MQASTSLTGNPPTQAERQSIGLHKSRPISRDGSIDRSHPNLWQHGNLNQPESTLGSAGGEAPLGDAGSQRQQQSGQAASFTSSGKSFTVSFILAPPPATSSYHCDWIIGGAPGHGYNSNDDLRHRIVPDRDRSNDLLVIEAHDDSVLIKMSVPERRGCFLRDYFLYETGGAARPPSLSLLPGCYISKQFEREKGPTPNDRPRSLDNWNTGVLRRGGGELQVAQLEVMYGDPPHDTAGLCVVRPGAEWDLKRLPIVHQEAGELPQWPELDAAVPVGVRFMCWVDYVNGFFLCDMAEPGGDLPRQGTHGRNSGRRPYLPYCRNLAAAGCDAVRFVSVAPRCCCGGHSETSCERSRFAFNVTTWTLTLRTEGPMTWVKDGVLDCDELWAAPQLQFPTACDPT
uniref:DUF1618 domain-containing protein n=1 Tax=Setaria italica TaxID=4555 RepID=K3ZMD7_SETIT